MHYFNDLLPVVGSRIQSPCVIALGSPWQVTRLAMDLKLDDLVCWQMDVYPANRLREKLTQEGVKAEVVVEPDLWDLPKRFKTVLFPATSHADRELKIDIVEQGFHILEEGGMFVTLSEYEKDTLFAKFQKKIFGKCGESPKNEMGMAFWSEKHGDQPRRRHEMTFHAKVGDHESMRFITRPGTFGYGRMDMGSRAMLEVTEIKKGDQILDMGCGNGSVGCLAGKWAGADSTEPGAGHVTFIDSNRRATALAELNAEMNGIVNRTVLTNATLADLKPDGYNVILANPPYYADSEIARMFITGARDLLKPGGRFYLVTKMPVQTMPEVVETFGEVEAIENRGYSVLIAQT